MRRTLTVNGMTIDELLAFHRARFGDARMEADGGDGDTGQGGDGFKPITTQEEFNKAISERVSRERAKFADYKDLKAKADQLDQLQQANQTESEKFAQRIADLEKRNVDLERSTMRARIQAKHGISDEDAALFLTGTDEDTLTAQAKRLADREADRKKRGNVAPKEGGSADTKANAGGDFREFTRSLFGSADD